jgi:hypothetical protein
MAVSIVPRASAPVSRSIPWYVGSATLALAVGMLAMGDVESLRSWMLFALAGCVPPVLMAARGTTQFVRTMSIEAHR